MPFARPRTLYHITINTGHARPSPRSEVTDHVVAVLRAALDASPDGLIDIPGGYCRVSTDNATGAHGIELGAVEGGRRIPLVLAFLCPNPAHTAAAWRLAQRFWGKMMKSLPPVQMPPDDGPWLAAAVLPTIALRPQDAGWLGDAERCVAWALLERGHRST